MSGLTVPPGGGSTTTSYVSGESSVSGGQSTSGTSSGQGVGGTGGTVPDTTGSGSSSVQTRSSPTPPNDGGGQNRLQEGLKKIGELFTSLDDLLSSVKDPDLLAAIMIELSGMSRQAALDQRIASRETAKSQLEGQAAETREAAIKEIAAAVVAVVMAVVSFAVSMVGALKMGAEVKQGAKSGMEAGTKMDKLDELSNIDTKDMPVEKLKDLKSQMDTLQKDIKVLEGASNTHFKNSDVLQMKTSAISGLIKGISEAVEGSLRAAAKFDDAQGQVLAANAQDTETDADSMKTFVEALDELMKAALNFLQQMNEAEVELMASASRL